MTSGEIYDKKDKLRAELTAEPADGRGREEGPRGRSFLCAARPGLF